MKIVIEVETKEEEMFKIFHLIRGITNVLDERLSDIKNLSFVVMEDEDADC